MKQKRTYNAEDFERYHSGNMNPAEMHQLEKAALNDPFLAQALDGYQYTSDAASDMKDLRKRLYDKTEQKRRALPVFLRYAAAIVILIGLGTWFLILNKDSGKSGQQPALARIEQDTIVNDQSTVKTESTTALPGSASQVYRLPDQHKASNQAILPPPPMKMPVSTELAAAEEKNEKHLEPVSDNSFLHDMSYDLQKDRSTSYYKGQVTDTSGKPVPFATVISSVSGGIQTDANGKFQLPAPVQDTVTTSTISAAGYKTVTEDLKKNDIAIIKLEPSDRVVSEVVVTSAFNTKKNVRSQAASVSKPKQEVITKIGADSTGTSPIEGWEKFSEYVYDKLKEEYNPGNLPKKKGEVILSFNVGKNGRPTNISVVKSLGEEADARAIKILEQGPSWKYKKKNKKTKIPIPIK